MSVVRPEQLAPPETPSEQAWDRFHEAWRIPEAYEEEYREHFEGVVNRAKAECLDPTLAEYLEVGADFYRWFLFANRGDALPDSLALRKLPTSSSRESELVVSVHPDNPAAAYGPSGVINAFTSYASKGLEPLFNGAEYLGRTRPNIDRADRIQERADALIDIFQSGPVYSLLKSFNHNPFTREDRPLTPLERQTRQAIITRKVREKHGLQDDEPIHFRSHPDIDIRKQVAQLDDERVPGKSAGKDITPAERAREFFVNKVLKAYEQSGYEVVRVEYGAAGHPVFVLPDQRQKLYAGNPVVGQVVDAMVTELGSENALNRRLDREVLYNVISTLRTDCRWNEAIHDAVHHVVGSQLYYLSFNMLHTYMRRDYELDEVRRNLVDSPDWVQVLRPQGPIFDDAVYQENLDFPNMFNRMVSPRHRPDIVGRDRIQELSRQTTASVTRGERAMNDLTSRLMVVSGVPPAMPLPNSQFDLEINFSHQQASNVLIPGYQLSALDSDKGVYQFVKSDVDPYVVPEIVISDSDKGRLVEYYEREGYTALSNALKMVEHVHLTDLVSIISTNSDYTYDTQQPVSIPVVNGRPQIQCTGAAYLLDESLRYALSDEIVSGRASVVVFAGYVLNPGSTKVTGVGHEQISLTLDGKSYLLDATPVGDMAVEPGLRFVAGRADRRKRFLQRLKHGRGLLNATISPQESPNERDGEADETSNVTGAPEPTPQTQPKTEPLYRSVADQKVAERPDLFLLRGRLEQQLMAAFRVPNADALMKRLLQESKDDPVRRTLGLALRSTGDQGIDTDIGALKQYVANYERLTPAQRKQYRLSAYGADILRILSSYIDELST